MRGTSRDISILRNGEIFASRMVTVGAAHTLVSFWRVSAGQAQRSTQKSF